MGFLPFPSILRGGVMVTCVNGSDKLKVRFFSPAPIFIAFVLFFVLSGSASAVSLSENTLYSFGDFRYYVSDGSSLGTSYTLHYPSDPYYSVGSYKSFCLVASGSASGSAGSDIKSIPLTFFDLPDPSFRFVHVTFSAPRSSALVGLTYYPQVRVLCAGGTSTNTNSLYVSSAVSSSDFVTSFSTQNYASVYASSREVFTDYVKYDYYISFSENQYFVGFSGTFSRPSDVSSSDSWRLLFENFNFEVSSTKILPPSTSGSGDVDLSGITSQITQLSNDMSAQFLAVNQNIDSAESAITSAIEDQTTALSESIDQAAQDVNDHFDTWDTQLSGAFSSNDAQVIVDTDQSVSALHQFEQDQIDETDSALSSLGLDSYTIPSEYLQGSQNIGTFITLLFGSLSFVTPLVIFSCMLGIAAVLIGRKSKGDG